MGIIIKALVFACATLISIGSAGSITHTAMLQQISNSSVNILLACAYFLLIKAIEFSIQRVMRRDRTETYSVFQVQDEEDSLSEGEHDDTMRKAEEITSELIDVERPPHAPSAKSVDLPPGPAPSHPTESEEIWNVYTTVYLTGCSIFIVFYSIDMTSTLSGISLIIGVLIQQSPGVLLMVRHAMHEPDSNPTRAVNHCITLFSYVCLASSIVSFLSFTCTMEKLPDDMAICNKMTMPRVDVLFGILLPMLCTIPVVTSEQNSMDRIVLYKAAPFACFLAFVVVMFMGTDTLNQVTGNTFRQVSLFLLTPLFKGAAVIIFISSCMKDRRIETASILAFILFCKEIHNHKEDNILMQGLISGLVFSTLALIVSFIKDTKCIFDILAKMNARKL